ncbi:MAG: hypothetical protein MUC34_11255 [Anaerolineae bacterium]|jgi:hypothetical protein|nr:hypothetical protein [Anaerolineae bacterium]
MSRIFARERRQVGQGAGEPRFRIVASEGLDLRVYVPHMRRMELEQLAAATGCEIVYLPRGEQESAGQPGGQGRGRRHGAGGRHDEGGHAAGMNRPED